MAFCSQCGAKLPDGARFCPFCGAKATEAATEIATETTTEPSVSEPEYGVIVFARQPSEYLAGAASVIFIDKIHITDIYASVGAKVKVIPGRHTVDISIDVFHTMCEVDVEPGKEVYISHYLDPGVNKKQSQIIVSYEIDNSTTSYTSFDATEDDVIQEKPSKETPSERKCPVCGGPVNFQTVTETGNMGCGMILFVVLISLFLIWIAPILGIIVAVIGIIAVTRSSNETVTYAVCQKCGNRKRQS